MRNHLLAEVKALFLKEVMLEWRQKYAFNSIIVYIVSTVFVCYLSFNLRLPDAITWNALFWIILLFSAVNGISKSFQQEREGRTFFYYQLASPEAIIIAKMLYNACFMMVISLTGLLIFSLVLGNPVQDNLLFILNIVIGAIGFSSTLTMISGIASKAGNNGSLMAVMGLPVVLPLLLMLIKVSKNAMDGLARSTSVNEIVTIMAIITIVIAASVMLFPYLWRS
ncbi:heme exporter protein CcmB [Chondrinema litorale]|uniref:heme exporter protein CcmB n=1 Tax=Chondrinema litorale TaxID=2994555 RepID=UPI002542ACB3|nr:heme exporter protein CcmB [Chondrinema litorale]UZR93244.1 heme exporter protein CcmB [Chondrinema litorale]